MKSIIAILAIGFLTAISACETTNNFLAPAIQADTAKVAAATFSPLASSYQSLQVGEYKENAFTACLPRGSVFQVSLASNNAYAVVQDGWGWTRPEKILACDDRTQDEIHISLTIRGVAPGSAEITVYMLYTPPKGPQVFKLMTYSASVATPGKG
jgi:hypothetical protein